MDYVHSFSLRFWKILAIVQEMYFFTRDTFYGSLTPTQNIWRRSRTFRLHQAHISYWLSSALFDCGAPRCRWQIQQRLIGQSPPLARLRCRRFTSGLLIDLVLGALPGRTWERLTPAPPSAHWPWPGTHWCQPTFWHSLMHDLRHCLIGP